MRRLPGALTLAACLLGACGDIPIPVKSPDPFSEVLLEFLHLPFVGQSEVQRWLGDPDAIRMEGALAVYIEPRERVRAIPSNSSTVDVHYLLIEFDEHGEVSSCDEVIGEGCMAAGFCIAALANGRQAQGKPAEIKQEAARDLVVYRAAGAVRQVAGIAPPAGQCQLLVYSTAESYYPVYLQFLPTSQAYYLPQDGYLAWVFSPGSRQVRVSGHSEFDVSIDCEAGRTVVRRFESRKTGFWRASIDAVQPSQDEATSELLSRKQLAH